MIPDKIESERIIFKKISRDELSPKKLYKYVSEDAPHINDIVKNLPWVPHRHVKETEDFIKRCEKKWSTRESFSYVMYVDNEFIGLAGLTPFWDRKCAEIGLWLRKEFWGNGYSGERADVLIKLVFEELDLDMVYIDHEVDNKKSEKAIKKYVSRYNGQYDGILRNYEYNSGEIKDVKRYTILKNQYYNKKE